MVDLEERCKTVYLDTLWKLMDEEERKKHLLNGMKEACEYSAFNQDSRAMCPEITTTAMLEGMAFIDFTHNLCKAIKEQGPEKIHLLPSYWWQSAVDLPQPWSVDALLAFTQLSVIRKEFIGGHALSHAPCACGNMNVVLFPSSICLPQHPLHFTRHRRRRSRDEERRKTRASEKHVASVRDKPLIRCENCTKTQDEKGGDLAFMLRGGCKSKLDFIVHYCSKCVPIVLSHCVQRR
jgi:hypothetical protein